MPFAFYVLVTDVTTSSEPIPEAKKIWSMIGKILLHNGKNLSEAGC